MFTVELKVNGTLVGHLYGVNKGPVVSDRVGDLCYYDYHYYDVAKETIVRGRVTHRRSNGLQILVGDCLMDATARREDENP